MACVKNQTFGASTKIVKNYDDYKFGGVVGMGFYTSGQIKPVFYNMIDQLGITPYFGLYLSS